MSKTKRMPQVGRRWLTLDEAAKELGTDREGLRQALESGDLPKLPVMVYSGAGLFPAEICVRDGEPVECPKNDADGQFLPQNYREPDEWYWLRGYFRLHPSCVRMVALNKTLYQADVSLISCWDARSEVPRNEKGEVGVSFFLRTRDSEIALHPGTLDLDPVFSLDHVRFSAADIVALNAEFPTMAHTVADELTINDSGASNAKWPWGSYETKALRLLEVAAKRWWVRYDPEDSTTASKNQEVAAWLVEKHGATQRMGDFIASILRADGLRTGPRK